MRKHAPNFISGALAEGPSVGSLHLEKVISALFAIRLL